MMHALATYLAEEDLRGEAVLSTINKTVDAYGFLRCAITFPDGKFITHDSKNFGNSTLDEHVVKGLQGISSVTGPRCAVVDSTKTVILLTVPVYQGQKIVALLTCTYETKYLSNVFQMTSFDGKGYSYIADVNGSVIKTSQIHGAEALVRWQHPHKGLVMPDRFISLFEKNGFIVKLDMYMVEFICRKLWEWQDKNWAITPISVNQSRLCLYQPNYVQ